MAGPHHECLRACAACEAACELAARYCRERGPGYDDRGRVAALIHCAAFARTVADFLRAGSELAWPTLEVFAELCRRCAALCSEFDDEPLVACARECLACADSAERQLAGFGFTSSS